MVFLEIPTEMKAVFTETALADLDDVMAFVAEHYPAVVSSPERRIRPVVARISDWPESARTISQNPEIRAVPLVRYPHTIFYRIRDERLEILHIITAREYLCGSRTHTLSQLPDFSERKIASMTRICMMASSTP